MTSKKRRPTNHAAALILSLADLIAPDADRPGAVEMGFEDAPALVVMSERTLVRIASQLGATHVGGPLSVAERNLVEASYDESPWAADRLALIAAAIRSGSDPLGTALLRLRPATQRRQLGAFYTPDSLVEPMVSWVLSNGPTRVVDAGCGSGRFAAAVTRAQQGVRVIAVDLDPLATLITRATLAVLGARRSRVVNADYTQMRLPRFHGKTAFIGNPPYVRHHDLSDATKRWVVSTSERLGHRASALAGLHAHFFVATAMLARRGDVGCFVTSSEWLDVGYGSVVRHLLSNGLGGRSIHLIKPTAVAFHGAQTTAVITCFENGSSDESVLVRMVDDVSALVDLNRGRTLPMTALSNSNRWSQLIANTDGPTGTDLSPIGNRFRVSRGIVTGGNGFFVMTRARAAELGIEDWCHPAITDAKEILSSTGMIRDTPDRRVVLALPRDFRRSNYPGVDAYLARGELPLNGQPPLSQRYICAHRKPWWCVGAREAPPIVASYMARQAPAFALNPDRLIVLNIAHGLYPKNAMTRSDLTESVEKLNLVRHTFRGKGRTYQGGLEKFEPREMEALLIPTN